MMRHPLGQKLNLTKLDAAEAQLRTAVRMYFENDHLAPIYALANAVRKVVGQIGKHLDVETVQNAIAKSRGMKVEEMICPLSKTANFFKHADRDPTATISLEDDDVEVMLFFAGHDFGRVAGGMPIEAQVFEAWAYAATIERVSDAPLLRQQLISNGCLLSARQLPVPRHRRSCLRLERANGPQTVTLGVLFEDATG